VTPRPERSWKFSVLRRIAACGVIVGKEAVKERDRGCARGI